MARLKKGFPSSGCPQPSRFKRKGIEDIQAKWTDGNYRDWPFFISHCFNLPYFPKKEMVWVIRIIDPLRPIHIHDHRKKESPFIVSERGNDRIRMSQYCCNKNSYTFFVRKLRTPVHTWVEPNRKLKRVGVNLNKRGAFIHLKQIDSNECLNIWSSQAQSTSYFQQIFCLIIIILKGNCITK